MHICICVHLQLQHTTAPYVRVAQQYVVCFCAYATPLLHQYIHDTTICLRKVVRFCLYSHVRIYLCMLVYVRISAYTCVYIICACTHICIMCVHEYLQNVCVY
eukprot:GHVS01013907.1.p1 GENE.GHVS01013907.1~~GHVS01013907.1.p1  ORF type:complete len:103 (+),score=0.73 GHVS01013907.1:88-396(+)